MGEWKKVKITKQSSGKSSVFLKERLELLAGYIEHIQIPIDV